MSETKQLVNACPECESSQYQTRAKLTPQHRCDDCGHKFNDPIERERKSAGRTDGTKRLKCYHCNTAFYTVSEKNYVDCRNCNHRIAAWRGLIHAASDRSLVRSLATGAKTGKELPSSASFKQDKEMVGILSASTGGHGDSKSRPNQVNVYYLVGDERGAVSKYIEVNTEFVRDCLGDVQNPIRAGWSEDLYVLLVEQWHFLGYGDTE